MNRKLVFSFYINDNFHDEINEIHFKCLNHFKEAFDLADISFIVDEGYNKEYLREAQDRFLSMFLGKNISFSIVPNNEFRESKVFYDKIATRLKDEDLVFFGHNKGVTNVLKYDRQEIYIWVTGMYYFSLNFMDDVESRLLNEKYYCYGSFLSKNDEPEKCNKNGWYYVGTFFWINGKKLYQYMVNNEIQLPVLSDRFYDEEFLGNIIPTWPLVMAASWGNRYLVNCGNFYEYASSYIKILCGEDIEEYKKFYKLILPNGKIDKID